MPRVAAAADIAAAPKAIWELMSDPHRYPEFADPTDRMIDVPDSEFGVGYTYKEYGGVPPFKSESVWTVTVHEPMTRQVRAGDDGQMRFDLDIVLTSVPAGTRLVMTLDLRPRWYLAALTWLMWPVLMRKRAQQAMDRTVANTKRLAEAGR